MKGYAPLPNYEYYQLIQPPTQLDPIHNYLGESMEIYDSCKVGGGICFPVFNYTATPDILCAYRFLKFYVFNAYRSCINKSKYLDIPCIWRSIFSPFRK